MPSRGRGCVCTLTILQVVAAHMPAACHSPSIFHTRVLHAVSSSWGLQDSVDSHKFKRVLHFNNIIINLLLPCCFCVHFTLPALYVACVCMISDRINPQPSIINTLNITYSKGLSYQQNITWTLVYCYGNNSVFNFMVVI
jgi:hypothetical protein